MAERIFTVDDNFDFPAAMAARQAARLGDVATAEGATLANTYARATLPTSVGDSLLRGTYEPRLQLFNFKPVQVAKLHSRLARASAGLGVFKAAHLGDSIDEGANVSKFTESHPARIRASLTAQGYPSGGTGYVVPMGIGDTRWTLGMGWTYEFATKHVANCSVSGSHATFTSDVPGTIVRVHYPNSGAFTVSVDGAAAVTVPANTSGTLKTYEVAGLLDTTHVVKITTVTAATAILGVEVARVAGVQVSNFGLSGSNSAHWAQTDYTGPAATVLQYAPDFVTLKLGTNDASAGTTAAQYRANLQSLIDRLKGVGAEILLMVPIPRNALTAKMTEFAQELYALALANNLPLLDLTDRWGSYSAANALGLMSDTLHPNAAGYDDIATAILDAVYPRRMITSTPARPTSAPILTLGSATTATQPLSWTAVAGATSYIVEYRVGTGQEWTSITGLTGLDYTITGLASNTGYAVRVRASNVAGNGAASGTQFITTAPLSPLPAPSGVTAGNVTSTSFTVSWSAVPDATNYTVEWRLGTDSGFTLITGVTATTRAISGLTPNTGYAYRVRAVRDGTNGVVSGTQFLTTTAA